MIVKRKLINVGRKITAPLRVLPDFLIIGAQKAGTTSLFEDLINHPCVGRPIKKEIHYFDYPENFNRGVWWYRSHFPLMMHKFYSAAVRKEPFITGESSPYYLFHPHAARRVAEILPHVKIIVLLRNPVDRAFSHYQHEVNGGNETLSFEEAIQKRNQELKTEIQKMNQDEKYKSRIHQCYSYLLRGIYWQQLESWFQFFPKHQFLILNSESYFQEPAQVYRQVIHFLGLPEYTLERFKNAYPGKYTSRMSKAVRDYLKEFYKPHNEKLCENLGTRFSW